MQRNETKQNEMQQDATRWNKMKQNGMKSEQNRNL